MESINIDKIISSIKEVVDNHYIENGRYARWTWQNLENPRELGYNAYGCADAANILYTINEFPRDLIERQNLIKSIKDKQDKETGIFVEATHHDFHTTAHCIAALELFDERPLYPLTAMLPYTDFNNFIKFHEDVDWLRKGKVMHPGAALYAALVITDSVDAKWCEDYFEYLSENCNCDSGLWEKDPLEEYSVLEQMVTAFHYLFNYDYAKKAFPYPDRLIDSCIHMYRENLLPKCFGKSIQYIEMDWVYCLNRASRQTPHRFYEVREELYEFAKKIHKLFRKY